MAPHSEHRLGDVLIDESMIGDGNDRRQKYVITKAGWRVTLIPVRGKRPHWTHWRCRMTKPKRRTKTFKAVSRMSAFEFAILFARNHTMEKHQEPFEHYTQTEILS